MGMDLALRCQRLTLPEHVQILKACMSLPETSESSCPISWVAHRCHSWYILLNIKHLQRGDAPCIVATEEKTSTKVPSKGIAQRDTSVPRKEHVSRSAVGRPGLFQEIRTAIWLIYPVSSNLALGT